MSDFSEDQQNNRIYFSSKSLKHKTEFSFMSNTPLRRLILDVLKLSVLFCRMNSLLKNKKFQNDNLIPFPNIDECLKIQNSLDQVVDKAMKMAKAISPYMARPESLPVTAQDETIGLRETAKLLGVSTRTISRYRLEGRIGFMEVSARKMIFRKRDILAYMNRKYKAPSDYCE